MFTYTSKATWNCLGNITGLFSILFFYSATFLGGFNLTHITYSIFLFVKWREEKKVKFPLWAVSMLGCSWPRTFRNFSIKEGGTTCSKWASYLSILRSLSYATMDSEVLWSCINPIRARRFFGDDELGGEAPPLVSELWEVKTSKTHISQTDNVPSFNLSPWSAL